MTVAGHKRHYFVLPRKASSPRQDLLLENNYKKIRKSLENREATQPGYK
jgi:hypothetical protein